MAAILEARVLSVPAALPQLPAAATTVAYLHALEGFLRAAETDGVGASYLCHMALDRRRALTDNAGDLDEDGGIELTAELEGNQTTVIVHEGDIWRDEVAGSITEHLHSRKYGLNLEDCRVEVDGQAANAYELEGRIYIAP
jgi:hypothetical protein